MSNSLNLRFRRKQLQYLSSIKNWSRDKGGSVNDCWKPSRGASKADLREYHQEEMKLRRRRQLARKAA